ncbi:MAG TPA: hypothetical protein VHS97_18785 [Isosphaeraceae bacterium]|nr:hypothetical protein [Isosphaeraceae bacterium]
MALARQGDFLPALEGRLRDGERSGLGVIYLELAMRDDPPRRRTKDAFLPRFR